MSYYLQYINQLSNKLCDEEFSGITEVKFMLPNTVILIGQNGVVEGIYPNLISLTRIGDN